MTAWAWRQLWRDLRSSALRWLCAAVILAVAALSAVGLFADRIERGLQRDAAQLIGADVVVLGDQPLAGVLEQQARSAGLRTSRTAAFPSMARAPDERGGETRMVAVKAVEAGYPLRGRLTLRRVLGKPVTAASTPIHGPAGGPLPGTVWVDAGVLQALRLDLGDRLLLGDAALTIAAEIATEPDRGAGFVNFSPRVMLNWADLTSTALIQPASRVTWRLLTAGAPRPGDAAAARGVMGGLMAGAVSKPTRQALLRETALLSRFTDQAREHALDARGVRVETLEDGRPEMRATIDRAGLFLRLVALLAALMSAVVVAMVARDFAVQRLDDCALLRVLGVSQRAMIGTYVLELTMVGLLASSIGLLLGGAFHQVFVLLLGAFVQADLPAPGWWPVALSMAVGLALTLGFGLPPLLQLAQVPALRVLRRELGAPKAGSVGVLLGGLTALIVLLALVVRDAQLAAISLGGVVASVLLLAAIAGGLLLVLRRWLASGAGLQAPIRLRQAVRSLVAQPGATITQVCALSLGLLAVFLLILVRTDLIASWRSATPPDAPNRFVINIQPEQVESLQRSLREGGVSRFDWYPMVRARLLTVNDKPVRPQDFDEERAQRLVEREFNLSHAAQAPPHNEVTQGRYNAAGGTGEFSVEEGLAKTLGLKLGDRLGFEVAGQPSQGRITSLRKLDWASMRVNFFVMVPVASMPQWPATYISAFQLPPGSRLDRTLVARYPNITLIDVTMSLGQIQGVLNQVIAAVEFLFLFTLTAGVLVLLAGLWSSRERRSADWAVMRALGASRSHLQQVQSLELIGMGVIAGLMASVAALAIGGALAWRVFDFPWQPRWWVPLAGASVGAMVVLLAGWWSLRGLLGRPVLATLRRVD